MEIISLMLLYKIEFLSSKNGIFNGKIIRFLPCREDIYTKIVGVEK